MPCGTRFQPPSGLLRRALLVLFIVVVLSAPREVSAHALLLETDPAPNTLLDRVPEAVTLTFSEPVDPVGAGVVVILPDGRRVRAETRPSGTGPASQVRVPIRGVDASGTYVVRYSVLGRDGHLITGRYVFSVGRESEPQDQLPDPGWALVLGAAARWLHLVALSLMFGGYLLVLSASGLEAEAVLRARCQVVARRSALLAAGAAVLVLTAFAFSSPFLPDAGAVRDLLSTSSGVLWGSSVVVALLLYALLAGPVPRGVLVGGWGFGASALALFRAGAGHAATAPYPVLSIALAALHLAAASALIGGTLMLVMAAAWLREVTERVSRSAVRLVRRMFLSALLLSEVLTVSGAYNLWTNIATPRDLLATPYGRILLVKLAVATVALGIVGFAARSAFRSRNWTIRRLRWGALSVFLILPFATGLVMLPPPRAAVTTASIAARPLVLAQHAGPYLVTLRLDPALPGTNRVTVHVTAPNGTPVDDAQVTLAVETPQGPRLIGLRQGSQDYTTTIDMTTDLWSFDVYVQRPHETAVPPARFRVPVPVPDGRTLLQLADLAMNRLQSVEERTELTSGGPVVVTVIRYAAPDRATYTVSTSGRPPSQTVIIGDRRYDRVGDGEWTVSPWPGSSPYRWPAFRYAESAEDVRILGIETIDSIPCYLVSFHDPRTESYYRLWIGVQDLRIRRYEMMATGHYMVGSFDRFDDPSVVIEAPTSGSTHD